MVKRSVEKRTEMTKLSIVDRRLMLHGQSDDDALAILFSKHSYQ